ncbi:MAG: histidinol dehydrogenase [Haloferacaceae archaeon]
MGTTYLKRPADDDGETGAVRDRVREIRTAVRDRGDEALREFTERFDGVERDSPLLSAEERDRALARLDEETRRILEHNHGRIEAFAKRQRASLEAFEEEFDDGIVMGQTVRPVPSVGAYVPGGRYPLLSAALMTVTPAAVAGVPDIAVATPPADGDGLPHAATVYAADLAGADRLYVAGGAQAVAALAYGTGTVEPVDKVVGPGNAYTTEAKRQVYGEVGIDLLAGPSEVCVLADGTADPDLVAADLLAQAEHDTHARPLLVSTDRDLAAATVAAVERRLETLATADVAGAAWENEGTVVVADSLDEAVAVTNDLAPEHLEVHVAEPRALLDDLDAYGSLFLGEPSAVVYSDKCVGTNHVLPTDAGARYTGGLSVFEFLRVLTHQELDAEGAERVRPWAVAQSRRERLEGHARSAYLRGPDADPSGYEAYDPRLDGGGGRGAEGGSGEGSGGDGD